MYKVYAASGATYQTDQGSPTMINDEVFFLVNLTIVGKTKLF